MKLKETLESFIAKIPDWNCTDLMEIELEAVGS